MRHLIGQSFGRYEIISLLGEGGMGAVFKGKDVTLQRDVAVKVLRPHLLQQPGFQDRFLQEARAAAQLNHPGIVQIYDFGKAHDHLYLVMEFVPGANMARWMEEKRAAGDLPPLIEQLQLVQQICLTLVYVHQHGVLHRDIKPDNILFKADSVGGLEYRPVLTDLGLAKLLQDRRAAEAEETLGTPAYMAPEQVLEAAADARTDLYAVGVLLHELTTGDLPFNLHTLAEAVRFHSGSPAPPNPGEAVPAEVAQIITKAMAFAPADRYADARTMAQALVESQNHLASPAERPTLIPGLDSSPEKPLTSTHEMPAVPASGSNLAEDQLVLIEPDGGTQTVQLGPGGLVIGRKAGNDLVIDRPEVSRRHARIDFDGSHYTVTDLGSGNGSFLGQTKLKANHPTRWQSDQMLHVGKCLLRLELAPPPEAEETDATVVGMMAPGFGQPDSREEVEQTLVPAEGLASPAGINAIGAEADDFGQTIVVPGVDADKADDFDQTIVVPGQEPEADDFDQTIVVPSGDSDKEDHDQTMVVLDPDVGEDELDQTMLEADLAALEADANDQTMLEPAAVDIDSTMLDAGAAQPASPPPDPTIPRGVGLSMRITFLSVTPGNSVAAVVDVVNKGMGEDTIALAVDGIPLDWVAGATTEISLVAGQRRVVRINIQPPRSPEAMTGRQRVRIVASSQADPSKQAVVEFTLDIGAFSQFSSELTPAELKSGDIGKVTIQNTGNRPDNFRIVWHDQADQLEFNPPSLMLNGIKPGETVIAEFWAAPEQRRWLGGAQRHPITAQVMSGQQQVQTHEGHVVSSSLFLPVVLPALAVLFAIVAAAGWFGYQQAVVAPAQTAQARQASGTATAEAQAVAQNLESTASAQAEATTAAQQAEAADATATAGWADLDEDGDGLTNGLEADFGTAVDEADSDGDGLSDGDEVDRWGTDPTVADTDEDGVSDGAEVDSGDDPLQSSMSAMAQNESATDTPEPSPTASPTEAAAAFTPTPTSTQPAATPTPQPTVPTATPRPTVPAGPTAIPLNGSDTANAIGAREVTDVDFNPRNPLEVYTLAKGDGIYKSTNAGEGPWTRVDLDGSSITSVVIHPQNPLRIYATTWNAVLRSDDGGNSWKAFSNGLSTANRVVDVVTVDPENSELLYAGIGSTLVVSTDGGETWVSEGYGQGLLGGRLIHIVVDPFNNDTIYIGGFFGSIYKSVDSGRTFSQLPVNVGEGTFGLVAHPTQRDVYLAGINSFEAAVIKTENGADFRSISNGLIFGGADSAYSALTFAPSDPTILYVGSGYEDDRFAKGIFKTTNGGQEWNGINSGLSTNSTTGQPHYVKSIIVHPANPNVVLAATGGGLFKTTNGGASWSLK